MKWIISHSAHRQGCVILRLRWYRVCCIGRIADSLYIPVLLDRFLALQQRFNLLYNSGSGSVTCVDGKVDPGEYNVRSRASKAFTYPLFGPLFLRTSSYAQSCASLLHVPHVGLAPSQRNFLFRQSTHAIRFVFAAPSPSRIASLLFVRAFGGRPSPSWILEGCRDRSLK